MAHAVDPRARRVAPDSFKNVAPSANVRMALLPGVHVLVHFRALNRISGIRRNAPRSAAPSLSAKSWPTNREEFRPPR